MWGKITRRRACPCVTRARKSKFDSDGPSLFPSPIVIIFECYCHVCGHVCGTPIRSPIKVLKMRCVLSQDQEEKDYLAGAQIESDSESDCESDKLNVTFTMSDLKVCIIGDYERSVSFEIRRPMAQEDPCLVLICPYLRHSNFRKFENRWRDQQTNP